MNLTYISIDSKCYIKQTTPPLLAETLDEIIINAALKQGDYMSNSLKYKEIEFPIPRKLSPAERVRVEEFFKIFPKEDFNVVISDDTLQIFLNNLNFQDFKERVNLSISNGFSNTNAALVLQATLDEIEGIKSYGIKGNKRVYVGYNDERKVANREEKESKRQLFYYTEGHSFSPENNIVPANYADTIICGDSEEVLSKLPDNCIDIIVTSPPYNFGLDYSTSDDTHHWDKYFNKLFRVFSECVRVLKYGGRICVNVQPLFSDYIPTHHIVSNFFMSKKLIWKTEILWEKNNYNCKYTAWGSWKSPSNPYMKYTWEFIEVFCKGSLKKTGESKNADISGDEFKKWVLAQWSIAPERNMKQFDHPAMFPEEVVLRCLKMFSFKGDVVLDPFNGAGTTTLVAKKLERKYIGIDVSSKYCNVAQERVDSILL